MATIAINLQAVRARVERAAIAAAEIPPVGWRWAGERTG